MIEKSFPLEWNQTVSQAFPSKVEALMKKHLLKHGIDGFFLSPLKLA